MQDLFKAWGDAQQSLWKAWMSADASSKGEGQANLGTPALVEQFNELRDVWKASIEKWAALTNDSTSNGAISPDALQSLFTPSGWSGKSFDALDAGLRQLVEGPKYAVLWDIDRKIAELNQATLQRTRDVDAYRAIIQRSWNEALAKYSSGVAKASAAEAPESWRALAERWIAVLNDTLIETYRSEEFLEAQRSLLRTASDCRLKEQAIAEAFCEANHVPTRSEVDELQRTVVQLRRQVRALQRHDEQVKAQTDAIRPHTARTGTRVAERTPRRPETESPSARNVKEKT